MRDAEEINVPAIHAGQATVRNSSATCRQSVLNCCARLVVTFGMVTILVACQRHIDVELSWVELNHKVQMLLEHGLEGNEEDEVRLVRQGIALTMQTIAASREKDTPRKADLVNMYRLAGYLRAILNEAEASERCYRQALVYAEYEYGPNHIEVAECLYWLAVSAAREGTNGHSEGLLERALNIMQAEREQAAYNPNNHLLALDAYGYMLRERGAHDKADIVYETAFDVMDSMREVPEAGYQILRSGTSYYMINNMHAQALPFVKRMLTLSEKDLADNGDDRWGYIAAANAMTDMAIIYTSQGRYVDAEQKYERAIMLYENTVGNDNILTTRSRDHMEYMQRKRNGEELLDDDPPPYIYPRGARIDEYHRLEQYDYVEERISAKEVLPDDIVGLGNFVSNYVSLVREEDLESLYELLHPKVRDDLSEEQKIALMMFDVRTHLRNIDAFTVDCKAVSKAEMAEIEERAFRRGSQYVIQPQVKVSITIEIGPQSKVTIPVYASKHGDEWYMVQAVPGEGRTRQLYDIYRELLRKSQSQSEGTVTNTKKGLRGVGPANNK